MAKNKEYLLIFDWDGVVVDSTGYYFNVYNKICLKYNREFPIKTVEQFREWYDSSWENNYYRLGFEKDDVPEIIAFEKEVVNYKDIHFFDNMKDILFELSKDYYMGVASTTPAEKIESKIREEGMEDVFSIISGGDGISDKKNKIKKVMDYFNVPPDKCLMFGDTAMDIVSSGSLGVKCIAISCGWNSRNKLEDKHPYTIVDSHRELPLAVKNAFPN